MNRTIKYITCLLGLALMTACTDLGEEVYDKLPKDTFGNTPEQLNAIIGPAYKSLKRLQPYDSAWGMSGMTSDAMIAPTRLGGDWWDGGMYMEQTMHTWDARSYSVQTLWDNCTAGLTAVNAVYSIVETNDLLSPELKARYLGELRGLRAFWYYQLIDYFGNVPLVTDFKDTSLPSITPREQVYQFIVDELNEIIPVLRDDVSDESYGKFTQGAARTLLAKMYLNAEEWTGTPNWSGVIEQCEEIKKLGYSLTADWTANFTVHNESSREIILPICFSATDGGNSIHLYTLHYLDPIALGFKAATWNGICGVPDFVKAFDDADSRKEATFLIGPMIDPSTGEVLMTTANRPLNHTVDLNIVPGTEKRDAAGNLTGWGEVNQEDGARIKKWQFERGMANTDMENDVAIFRLADVYLMEAEALVRLGRAGEALPLVNEIRQRAFGNTQHNYNVLTLEDVYRERRFELAYEFTERQDMIRFGTFLQPKFMKPYVTESYRKLLPIPFTAWQKNNKLTQNPGYPGF
ncbi:RagB/SusD family nutrient uptake outer membrane protein [Parapedobacter defluvii]|uniref:RagB/SusD family nutrient uptake outer membrane protein n=1 Tax=Parapedobacter defluvii TaxID=2045106 RepID=UPI000FA65344|nr:MAG: RagB/SusD family nutrient uptake outer membrane protein [Parapedobacter sp.]